ncbi:MAG: hypothetical protein WKG07_19395 [Hymenobacter sp.]
MQGNLRAVRTGGERDHAGGFRQRRRAERQRPCTWAPCAATRTAGLQRGRRELRAEPRPAAAREASTGCGPWCLDQQAGQPSAAAPASVTLSWASDDDNGLNALRGRARCGAPPRRRRLGLAGARAAIAASGRRPPPDGEHRAARRAGR